MPTPGKRRRPILSLVVREPITISSLDTTGEKASRWSSPNLVASILTLLIALTIKFQRIVEKMVFWVFGYGSLVWNPGFEYDEKVIGFVKSYKRVFDLACIDHRGTPERPARTCTLENIEGAICWGAAFCVRGGPDKERSTMEFLEQRECEYDKKILVNFYQELDPARPALTGVIVFTSTPDSLINKYYLGPAPLEQMARQIATASGPCGNNRDYVFLLEKTMSDIGHEDDVVVELADEVRKVLGIAGNGYPAEKRMAVTSMTSRIALMSHLSSLPRSPLPEPVAAD